MTSFVTLPGIGNSGGSHWQSHWEAADARFQRFAPTSWDEPVLRDWISALERTILAAAPPIVLVPHSLACLMVAYAAEAIAGKVAGAFLVAVPDPSEAKFPKQATTFRDPPEIMLPFRSLMIASRNDPYGTSDYARARASQWGCSVIDVGELGHINGASGLGDWTQGRDLLTAFCAGLGIEG